MKLNLTNKKVAVIGLGVSGLSAIRFLKLLNAQIYAINSGEKATWSSQIGVADFVDNKNCFSQESPEVLEILSEADLIILSPGIPRDVSALAGAHERLVPIWGEIELAFQYLESNHLLSPIIAITGTNGKTTTTTFLGEMIAADDKKVFVGGNIGVPFCDYAFDVFNGTELADYILLELSSFQLESIERFHVDIALVLNLFQNHGERYSSIEDYGRSKFNITNFFTKDDLLIYPEEFDLIKRWAQTQVGRKISISTTAPQVERNIQKFKLPGVHNRVNLAFVLEVAKELGLSDSAIDYSISHFNGVHHRIEYVQTGSLLNGWKVFNDAKSTNWDATLTAVRAMEEFDLKLYLIIGGKKRGHGDSIAPYMAFLKAHVEELLLIGEMAQEIENEIKGQIRYFRADTLELALEHIQKLKHMGEGILLFSPAFPSFDQFRNYAHRGDHFVSLVSK